MGVLCLVLVFFAGGILLGTFIVESHTIESWGSPQSLSKQDLQTFEASSVTSVVGVKGQYLRRATDSSKESLPKIPPSAIVKRDIIPSVASAEDRRHKAVSHTLGHAFCTPLENPQLHLNLYYERVALSVPLLAMLPFVQQNSVAISYALVEEPRQSWGISSASDLYEHVYSIY